MANFLALGEATMRLLWPLLPLLEGEELSVAVAVVAGA
ncbi:hypothetical protein CY0110_16797 [Crocosphaera chwakensis CCY0110]|uniref:Uncharacterized protein n=1 Tax=Crocosphaera chwakensis CCY0110 TaxID=391612 RepID=A3II41_9CHRO|nr:hypothetical protein CY0110_16797 [Crocosphaera chwakensis CCY0110]